ALLLASMQPAAAHDMPNEVRVHVLIKPEGNRLAVLVRIPLEIMLNIDFPKEGPGYLALAQAAPAIQRALGALENGVVMESDRRQLVLADREGRISRQSDRSFETWETADALLSGPPLPATAQVFWNQGYFDARLTYAIDARQNTYSVDFRLAPGLRERLKIDLRYLAPDGTVRAYNLGGGAGLVALDPRWYQAAGTFIGSGFRHILDGPDHLLFLLCLVIPLRRLGWRLAGVISAFTLGHSITLIAAAYRVVPAGTWFAPLVEFAIALSILYMAFENAVTPDMRRRWLLAAGFGLVHGFGFSFVLQSQLQFAGSHLLLSLLGFNLGIELGQLLVLLVALPALSLLYRAARSRARILTVTLSLLIGHVAWHWAAERYEALRLANWRELAENAPQMAVLLASSGALAALLIILLRRRAMRSQPELHSSERSM
ncbi:MAG: HupE/UreJ family protein, partial [Janthinobacterium lividum]